AADVVVHQVGVVARDVGRRPPKSRSLGHEAERVARFLGPERVWVRGWWPRRGRRPSGFFGARARIRRVKCPRARDTTTPALSQTPSISRYKCGCDLASVLQTPSKPEELWFGGRGDENGRYSRRSARLSGCPLPSSPWQMLRS